MKAFWRLVVERSSRFAALYEGKHRDLFVSPQGDDSGPGTIEEPLKTIGHALSVAGDGMGIYPMSGRYREELVLERPVLIRPLRRSVVVLEGEIVVRGSWVDLVGLIFDGAARPIRVEPGAERFLIRQCKALQCAGPALHVQGPACPESFIQGNALEGTGAGTGILFESGTVPQETVVSNNRIRNFGTGIQVSCPAGEGPPQVPELWDNEILGCDRPILLSRGGEESVLEDRQAGSASEQIHVSSEPRTYFVAPNGDDAASGSCESPLVTLGASLRKACPGDTVRLREGTYEESDVFRCSGTASRPITIESAPGERAVFLRSMWTLRESSHLIVRNVVLERSPLTSLLIEEGSCHNLFEGLEIVDGGYEEHCFSLLIEGPGAQHNRFLRCRFVRCEEVAASDNGDTADITSGVGNYYNRFEHCLFKRYRTAFHLGHGAYAVAPSLYTVLAFNEFAHNSRDGIHVKTSDNLIYGNHVHDNWQGLATRGAERNRIVGNCVERNSDLGFRGHGEDHVLWGNVFRENQAGGARLFHINTAHYRPAEGFEVRHNLFLVNGGPAGPAALVLEAGTAARIESNVFVGAGGPLLVQDPLALVRHANQNVYHNGLPPLLRECDGGSQDIRLDPEIDDTDPLNPVVKSPEAMAALGWPEGRPPEHPEAESWLARCP